MEKGDLATGARFDKRLRFPIQDDAGRSYPGASKALSTS